MNGVHAQVDPYLRHTSDFTPPIGMTPLDQAKHSPGRCLARVYEHGEDRAQSSFAKRPEEILVAGACVGKDPEDGKCTHFTKGMPFLGFLVGQTSDRAVVNTRGSLILSIVGVSEGDRGKPVFCTGPNSFSLRSSAGSQECGAVRHVAENGRAAVAFRSTGDCKPLDLDIRRA